MYFEGQRPHTWLIVPYNVFATLQCICRIAFMEIPYEVYEHISAYDFSEVQLTLNSSDLL